MQKQNLKTINLKSEKGSITVFVTAAMLFLLMILVITFMSLQNKNQAQLKEISKVKQEYEQELENIDAIYEETELKYNIGVSFSTNGGNYYIAKGGTVDFNTEITITNKNGLSISKKEYAFGTSQDTAPESWTTFTGNTVEVSKKANTVGEYYLWVKIQTGEGDERIEVSNVFAVIEEEIELKANTEEINKGPVQVTIDYKNAYTKNKKLGIGATLDEAKQNAVSNESTAIEVSENSYVYVTAEDNYGNVGEAYIQISNIDNQKPVITLSPNGGTFKTEEDTVTIDVKIDVKDDQSGVEEVKYAWSTSNTEKPADEEFTTIDPGETITSPELGEGKHYLWVIAKDKVGNVTEEPSFDYNVVPPAAPTVTLKENDANGAEYVSGTWTSQDVYHEITLPEDEGKVAKYQYSLDGKEWNDYIIEDENEIKINYTTTFPVAEDNKSSYIGDLTNNGEYYFVPDGNGAIKPTNGDRQELGSTEANSYIRIDLTTLPSDKSYKLTLNAEVSSENNYDYGYATITENADIPSYENIESGFINISGSMMAKDYFTVLEGGKEYYLHIGYCKDSSVDNNDDTFIINSLSLKNVYMKNYHTTFPMNLENTPKWLGNLNENGEYYFITDGNGAIEPTNGNNQGLQGSEADSYIKIDLKDYEMEDELRIIVNAQISSAEDDYGIATISTTSEIPGYELGNFFHISGQQEAKNYEITLFGGEEYYLHFGYYKYDSQDKEEDTFKINSITFSSETIMDPVNVYDYSLEGNKLTYKLKRTIDKEFYVRAIYENGNNSGVTKYKIQIDKKIPIINSINLEMISATRGKITVEDIEENHSGIYGYYISTDEEAPTKDSDWKKVTAVPFEINDIEAGNVYYIWLIDNAGNISEPIIREIENMNYKIDDNKYSITLEEALEVAEDGSKIELLRDYTDYSSATIDKSIIIDTKDFILGRTTTIRVTGTTEKPTILTVNGKITTSSRISTLTTNGTVILNGEGMIENTNDSSKYKVIDNSGTLTQNGNLTISGEDYGVYNTGTYTLNSGKVISKDSYSTAIYNYTSGDTININGGEVVGYSAIGSYNGSIANINGGRIESTDDDGIDIYKATVTVNDGEIIGNYNGINVRDSATLNILGGYVKGRYGIGVSENVSEVNVFGGIIVGSTYGINGYAINAEGEALLTIGDINTEVNGKQPIIYGEIYGVYSTDTTSSYNFYNGTIMGRTPNTYTDIMKPREGYMPYTYYDYDNAKRYCTILTKEVNNITIEQSPKEWTNQDVEVMIRYPIIENITKQYSEDGINWINVDKDYTKIMYVSQNKTIYARMLDSQGILVEPGVAEHKVENIDKIAPEVVVTTEKTKYTILEENQKVDISYSISASDEGGSNLKEAKYAFAQGNEEPQEYQDITNGLQITKNLGKGTYYLWFKVSDNAGNVSSITKMRFMVDLKEPVAQIGDIKYETIQDAFDAAGQTPSTIIILKDTDEVATLLEGQTVTLDLQGHTVGNSKDEAVIINNGTLTIIDTSSEKTGTIDNLVGTGIENNGTLTIGDNSNAIEDAVPTIKGNKIGIQNNSTLNYYDGTIIGKSAISGEVQSTPENYGPVGVYENGITTVNLKIVSDYVARIDWFYYASLPSAFDVCIAKENNTEQTTVHMLKDIVLENKEIIEYGKNIILDLNGKTLTSLKGEVIENYGEFEITDLSEEQSGNITSYDDGTNIDINSIITNKGYLKLTGGMIKNSFSEMYTINNVKGTVKISGGTLSSEASNAFNIYNNQDGIVKIESGSILTNGSWISRAIWNEKGTVEINGGEIICAGTTNRGEAIRSNGKVIVNDGIIRHRGDGIYNESYGIVEINGGTIESANYGNGVYNIDNGTLKINGGEIKASDYGIRNIRNSIVEMSNGVINVNNGSYGIYNEELCEVRISGGTINMKSSNEGSATGIHNKGKLEVFDVVINVEAGSPTGIYNNEQLLTFKGGIINCKLLGYYNGYGIYNNMRRIRSICWKYKCGE